MKINQFLKRFLVLSCLLLIPTLLPADELPIDTIKLPPGFKIEVYADNVSNARSLALGDKGTVFVGNRSGQNVYAIVDKDGDMRGDRVVQILDRMRSPNGVAFKDGSLYVAEISRVWRLDNIEDNLDNPPEPVLIRGDYPKDGHHGWKFIRFGPDGWLYVPVGAPCNVCERDDKRYSSITRMQPNGSSVEIFASGVRNSVGFDWHPETKELWFTDNGRDMLGDDFPPDELNHAPKKGLHFGFPYCHGKGVPDPKLGKYNCKSFRPPAVPLGPHVASLGMRFYTGKMFPSKYQNQIFIAEHGSWNRSKKIGYRIMLVTLEGSEPKSYEVFAEGWLDDGAVWGRPVDIQIMPDGSLLVSDDYANVVYRISYDEKLLAEKSD